VNSPGGYASIVEDVYYALRRLSGVKPVAAVVEDLAASGGLYVTMGCNYTYAEPTSFVGDVGIIVSMPGIVVPSNSTLETGPYKLTGFPVHDFAMVARGGLDNFLKAIEEGRGARLNTTAAELSLGKLYLGSVAVRMGLVDRLGSVSDAVAWAAAKAKVTDYNIVDITKIEAAPVNSTGSTLLGKSSVVSLSFLRGLHPEPLSAYYLSPFYIEGYRGLEETAATTPTASMGVASTSPPHNVTSTPPHNVTSAPPHNMTGAVLLDESHGNTFAGALMGNFFGRIVQGGYTIYHAEKGMNFTRLLAEKPKALIVITPTTSYSTSEVKAVKGYVAGGGRLLLVYDASTAWAQSINGLSQSFGVYFSDGYLYNLEDNYGVYRNIIVTDLAKDQPIFAGVTSLTMFTATHIYGNATALARTSASTYLSLTESQGVYTTVASSAKGRVTAVSDLASLLDPYSGVSDNLRFTENLAENLTK
jgi:hypothetical protein